MSDDIIKRSDAIGAVWGDDINPSEDGMVFEAQSHINRDIRLIPSADRPQGEWIYTNNPLRLDDEWECSRCGNISFVKTNFCDRCGARMKGADDE